MLVGDSSPTPPLDHIAVLQYVHGVGRRPVGNPDRGTVPRADAAPSFPKVCRILDQMVEGSMILETLQN